MLTSSRNCGRASDELAVGVEHERRTVEHELVLAADLVHVHRARTTASAARVASIRSRSATRPA